MPSPSSSKKPRFRQRLWLWIGGVILILAGLSGFQDFPAALAAPVVIVAGALLLPPVWAAVSRQLPAVRRHSTLLRGVMCVIALAIFGALLPKQDSLTPAQPPSFDVTTAIRSKSSRKSFLQNRVSKADFDRIRHGMSYREVVEIIGLPGEEMSSNRLEGVPGVIETLNTIMYAWQNRDGSNMNAIFQNDKLVQKAQFGLK